MVLVLGVNSAASESLLAGRPCCWYRASSSGGWNLKGEKMLGRSRVVSGSECVMMFRPKREEPSGLCVGVSGSDVAEDVVLAKYMSAKEQFWRSTPDLRIEFACCAWKWTKLPSMGRLILILNADLPSMDWRSSDVSLRCLLSVRDISHMEPDSIVRTTDTCCVRLACGNFG